MNIKTKKIWINEEWCKRCGICAEFCPKKVLAIDEWHIPRIVNLKNCIICRMCEMRCPEYAIFVDEIKDL